MTDGTYTYVVSNEKAIITGTTKDISGKVDKVEGYSLISDSEIERLSKVSNYDDTEIRGLIPTKVSQLLNDRNYLIR